MAIGRRSYFSIRLREFPETLIPIFSASYIRRFLGRMDNALVARSHEIPIGMLAAFLLDTSWLTFRC